MVRCKIFVDLAKLRKNNFDELILMMETVRLYISSDYV